MVVSAFKMRILKTYQNSPSEIPAQWHLFSPQTSQTSDKGMAEHPRLSPPNIPSDDQHPVQ